MSAKVEVIGGDYLEYRFGTWRKALGSFYSGSIASSKIRRPSPPARSSRISTRSSFAARSAAQGSAAMNPHRTYQENMDALKKVLTQRTLLALSRRNVEFVLAHQADSKQQLADYLRQCRAELGHIPGHRGDRRRSHRAALPGLGERPMRQRRPGGAGHPARPPRADEDRPFPEGI